MRTSFHHQPEAQHPNFPLSTSRQADYPIFGGEPESEHAALAEPDAKFENEENNQDQKATSCCGNPLRRHELPSSPLGKRAAPPVIWQQPSAPRDIRVALESMANQSRGECHVQPQNLLVARRRWHHRAPIGV